MLMTTFGLHALCSGALSFVFFDTCVELLFQNLCLFVFVGVYSPKAYLSDPKQFDEEW